MGFIEYLSGFIKNIGFFIFGFVLVFMSGQIMSIGEIHPNKYMPAVTESNPIASIAGIIVFIIGLAMVGIAFSYRKV